MQSKLVLVSFGIILNLVSASPAQGDLCTKPYSCAGCSQVRICRHTPSGLRESFRFSCSGTTPYCDEDSGTCTAMPTRDCADIGVLTCMQDGMFPDLTEPNMYHVCLNGTSHSFSCQKGYFDGKGCSTIISSYTPFSCSGTSGVKVKHYLDDTVFAYCVNSKVIFVDRCPQNFKLYSGFQECLPVCTDNDQLIADPTDISKYYRCSKDSSNKNIFDKDYSLQSLNCPSGETFDSSCSCCSTKKSSCACSNDSI